MSVANVALNCALMCFGFDDEAEKICHYIPGAWEECIEKAIEICPAECIHWEV